jgi:hypothetical protein
MSFLLKGKLADTTGNALSYYTIKIFDKDPVMDLLGDDPLGSSVTLDDGTFCIDFTKDDFKRPGEFWESPSNEPDLYFKVFDRDGIQIHETAVMSTPFTPLVDSGEKNECEAVVVGSGFGGTIVSLSLVNQLHEEDKLVPDPNKRKVVLLERGQWWTSHEVPKSRGFNEHKSADPTQHKLGLREYLEAKDIPYRTWAYPDNVNGLSKFLNTLRVIDRRGLYDYRISKNVHTLAASGVGGGSLVYANVTEKPHDTVIDRWDSELGLGINHTNLSSYFEMAKGFIGVNKITTTAGIGNYKLPKAKAFQDAAEKIKQESAPGIVTNETTFDPLDPDQNTSAEDIFAVDLSITDVPYREDEITLFKKASYLLDSTGNYSYSTVLDNIKNNLKAQEKLAVLVRKYSAESNVCERQGRCVLGCIPLARHLNNKKIFDYLNHPAKKKHFEVRALSEVYDIEPLTSGSYRYRLYYMDFGARDWKQASFNWSMGPNSYKLDVKLFRLVDGGKKRILECKRLVLSAGAIGSTEILLKSTHTTRTTGQKLHLSGRLGMGYSTNGDLLGVVSPTKIDIHATRGPTVTSAIKFNEGPGFVYTIEDSSIPKMFSGVSKLLSRSSSFRGLLGFVGSGSVQPIINMITQNPPGVPLGNTSLPVQISEDDLTNTLLLSGMGTDTSDGIVKLQDSWKNNPNRDMSALNVLNVDFDPNKLVPLFTKMRNTMEKIAKHLGKGGSASFSTPLWDPADANGSLTIVLHNLGGCSMGKDRNNGVVNSFGQVYKGDSAVPTETYLDFYVVDGGIVPTSIGVNSSLTISALAFRMAEKIATSPNYLPVESATVGTKTIYFPN